MAEWQEKCGVFGVYAPDMEVARVAHSGLWSLQHRGQEASGIAVADGSKISIHKNTGLVSQVFTDENLQQLEGHIAVGHNRYSTTGGSTLDHVQPVMRPSKKLALAHNGNLPDTRKLQTFLRRVGVATEHSNDSEMMADAINYYFVKGNTISQAVSKAFGLFSGAFSIVLLTKNTLVAFRDAHGIRPLVLATLGTSGYLVSSESCAFPVLGATMVRELRAGELITIDSHGLKSEQLAEGKETLDVFEFVYFARADSMLMGKRVNEVRRNLGKQLAHESPVKADVIVAVPDSAFPAAEGYSDKSGILVQNGFIKNGYVHRTFIQPEQHMRVSKLQMKLNPIPEVLQGRSVVLVDDSIVRGTTTQQLVQLIRQAGAREVHVRISAPPVLYPDFYGIDTPEQNDLIAATHSLAEITKKIGADSLAFLSYRGMIRAIGLPEKQLCTSCFTGKYPVPIGARRTAIRKVRFR